MGRPPRPGPCLNFGLQMALIRNKWLKNWDMILGLAWLKLTLAPEDTSTYVQIDLVNVNCSYLTMVIFKVSYLFTIL